MSISKFLRIAWLFWNRFSHYNIELQLECVAINLALVCGRSMLSSLVSSILRNK